MERLTLAVASGELDLTMTSKLVEQSGAIFAGDKPGRLVLDFADVLFIDFTGLGRPDQAPHPGRRHRFPHGDPRRPRKVRIIINYGGLAEHPRVKPAADPGRQQDPNLTVPETRRARAAVHRSRHRPPAALDSNGG